MSELGDFGKKGSGQDEKKPSGKDDKKKPAPKQPVKLSPQMSKKDLGGGIEQDKTKLELKGVFVKVAKGDTLCGLAKAFYGDKADCSPLRTHAYNSNVRDPLTVGATVFIPMPDLKAENEKAAATPKHPRKQVAVQIHYREDMKGPTITTLPPFDYVPPAQAPEGDLDTMWVDVKDELLPPGPPAPGPSAPKAPLAVGVVCPKVISEDLDSGIPYIEFPGGGGRTLDLSPDKDGKTRPFRLVIYENDRRASSADTLYIQELPLSATVNRKVTKFDAGSRFRAEILEMRLRATYTLPSCKGVTDPKDQQTRRCKVVTDAQLDPGKQVKLAVRVLRSVRAGGGKELALPLTASAAQEGGCVDPKDVQEAVVTLVRRIWAQARVQLKLVKLEVCEPPSDMLAVSDWDGLKHDPPESHLPENGKSAAANYRLEFRLRWLEQADSTKPVVPLHEATIRVDVAKDSTPEKTAKAIAEAINHECKLDEKDPDIARASLNPRQTNAQQASCDVVLAPQRGYMLIDSLVGGDADADQKVHLVHFDPTKVVISNFPESYHIGSPHHRQVMKTFPRGDADVIKIVVVADRTQVLHGFGADAVAFGLGRQRDFASDDASKSWVPCDEMYDTILGTGEMVGENKVLLAHELGHVLIDTPGHTDVKTQLMWSTPQAIKEWRIRGYSPAFPDWEAPARDTRRAALKFRDMPRVQTNAVARVHGVAKAVGEPVDVSTPRDGFVPLDDSGLSAISSGVKDIVDYMLGKGVRAPMPLSAASNYFAMRNDLMNGWYHYKDALRGTDFKSGGDKLETVRKALRAALQHGSPGIKEIIGGKTPDDARAALANAIGELNYQTMKDFLMPKLAAILDHEEFQSGFLDAAPACTALGPGGLLAGFTGSYCDRLTKVNRSAIFVTYERYGLPGSAHRSGRQKQPGPDRAQHCYTALHEAFHLNSFKTFGFQEKMDKKPKGAAGDWTGVLDEGTTELFTRIAYYHCRAKNKFPKEQAPRLPYFGIFPARFLPPYEVVKNVVAEIAADVGLKVLAQAYFQGPPDSLFEKLNQTKYNATFWKYLGKLSISPDDYMDKENDAISANNKLREGKAKDVEDSEPLQAIARCLKTDDLFGWMGAGEPEKYEEHDPAMQLYKSIASDLGA